MPAGGDETRAILEQLIRVFVGTPFLGSPSSLRVRETSYELNANGYRPKFMMSYCFCLLAACAPHAAQALDSLARDYTCFSPAPTVLFAELTGTKRATVSFARLLRGVLQEVYDVDLDLYSIQYLPCMFHRAAAAVLRAQHGAGLSAFLREDSIARACAKDHTHAELENAIAKASFLRQSGRLWQQMFSFSAPQRARVFRELQLDRAIAKPSAARHLVEEVQSRSIRERDWSNEWPRAGKATSLARYVGQFMAILVGTMKRRCKASQLLKPPAPSSAIERPKDDRLRSISSIKRSAVWKVLFSKVAKNAVGEQGDSAVGCSSD